MEPGAVIVGVDSGGTRTRAVAASADGRRVGLAEGPGGNYHNCGAREAAERIARVVTVAVKRTGWRGPQVRAVFVGAAGIKADKDIAAMRRALARHRLVPTSGLAIANDVYAAHAGALAGAAGIVLIAGTGTVALARSETGATGVAGGWGWSLDDVASGCWIGLEALRAVVRAADGRGPVTGLSSPLLKALGVEHPYELLERIYVQGFAPVDYAALAPGVMRLARRGDAVARSILERGAEEAAALVAAAAQGAGLATETAAVPVAIVGGVGRSGRPYQPMIEAAIRRRLPAAHLVQPAAEPVVGAVVQAMVRAGWDCPPPVFRRLRTTVRQLLSHD